MELLTIYCNAELPRSASALLWAGIGPHRLILAEQSLTGLGEADVAFGQPAVGQVIASSHLRWVQLSTAGFTNYDRHDVRVALTGRGVPLTKSSLVYDEPCAEQLLAFLCAHNRQLPGAFEVQRTTRAWPKNELRGRGRLLLGQSVAIVGFGSIGRRLVELLAPLRMEVVAIRRQLTGDEPVRTLRLDDPQAVRALASADHVIDVLPGSPSTDGFFDATRFAAMKPGAVFYNVGRGTTVDQEALRSALLSGHLAAAYLDVTQPEPLPPAHELWTTPNCFISPHLAGGHHDEFDRVVQHFLENLRRFTTQQELLDRVL